MSSMKDPAHATGQKTNDNNQNESLQAPDNVIFHISNHTNASVAITTGPASLGQRQTHNSSVPSDSVKPQYNQPFTETTDTQVRNVNTHRPSLESVQNYFDSSKNILEVAVCASLLLQQLVNLQQNQAYAHNQNQQQNIQQQQHNTTTSVATNTQLTTQNNNFRSSMSPSSAIGQIQTSNHSAPSFSLPQNQPTLHAKISQTTKVTGSITSSDGIVLALEQDIGELSPYQCLVRKQIEAFQQPIPSKPTKYKNSNVQNDPSQKHQEYDENEQITTQGRNRPIVPGQVGIRCRHCGTAYSWKRARGAILFPSTLLGVYQTAQNMANTHLIKTCKMIPDTTRQELINIRSREEGKKTCKSSYGGGRQYWADSFRVLGVVEGSDRRLRFAATASSDDIRSDIAERRN